jgi:hypothetical protein
VPLSDLVSRRGDLHEFRDITGNDLITFSVAQGVAQDGMDVLNLPG